MKDVDPIQAASLADEMELALGHLFTSFADKHVMSSLSMTTLALQGLIAGLAQLGGPQALTYTACVTDSVAARDAREIQKINRRAKRAMERMAAHYDGLRCDLRKRVMQ